MEGQSGKPFWFAKLFMAGGITRDRYFPGETEG
jgi:hypothetical protein